MSIHISEGNHKMGKIPSISLLPVVSCRADVPCHRDCYAQKACRRRDPYIAWAENTSMAMYDSGMYFRQIREWLANRRPKYFRWHVGGDILGQGYLTRMNGVALMFPMIRFLCFTKKYDLIFDIEKNLTVIFSAWPGLPLKRDKKSRRVAWMQDGTEDRIPKKYITCEGNCENCLKCFEIEKYKLDVVFHKH